MQRISKTKCIVFTQKSSERTGVAEIKLDGNPLPWVPEILHLGHHLECDSSMKKDISIKRGRFIGKINSLKQEFHYLMPDIKMKLYDIYTKSFYGSNLYSLFSSECERLYTSWNIAVRDCFNIPRMSHKYLIEEISQTVHPFVALSSRLVKFDNSLINTTKSFLRLLVNLKRTDYRTNHGKNLRKISSKCGLTNLEELNCQIVKSSLKYFQIPENETWRLGGINDMLDIYAENYFIDNFEHNDLDDILKIACTS